MPPRGGASRTRRTAGNPASPAGKAQMKTPNREELGVEFWWWTIAEISTDYLQACREFYTNEGFIKPRRDIRLAR